MKQRNILPGLFVTVLLSGMLFNLPFTNAGEESWNPEDVEFVAQCDGSKQKYVRVIPANFSNNKKHDLLIALHGHGSDRWQFVKSPRDECKSARDIAIKHDLIFISPDYRAKTSWMGPKAESDLLQIIKENKKKYQIGNVIISGGSMGGSSALTFTALHPELIAGVVSMNGTANHLEYQNFQGAIQNSFGGKKSEIFEEYKKRSAEYWPEQFKMPIAFSTGGQDKSVPPDSVLRLSSIIRNHNPAVLLIHRKSTGHSTNYEDAISLFDFVLQRINQ